jgi:ATP-dependent Clp protease ATP-binding subunit ClpC
MFERFTDSCRKAMTLANQQAQHYNHEYIGTEHILLGLARESESIGPQALHNMTIDIDKLRIEIEKLVKMGPDTVHHGKLPQTPRAKKVIEWAIDEARVLNRHDIGTEHLLLGLLRVKDGIACQVLNSFGITYNKARGEVLRLIGEESIVEETPVDHLTTQA